MIDNAASVGWLLLILGFLLFSNYCTNELGKNFYGYKWEETKIYDILHENTPDLNEWKEVNDFIPIALIISTFFIRNPTPLIKEFLGKYLLIMAFRAITMMSTILPKHEHCDTKLTWINMIKGHCYDKVFSGHMSFVFLATLIYLREGILSLPMFFAINVAQFLSIILTRSHYTVDVLLALFITYLVYDGDYHIFKKYF
jgi:hypothetical protein